MSDTAAVITEQQLDVLYNCIAKLEAALRQQGPMRVTYSVELLEATINKQVERIEARTGVGGPGDLAWLWPLSTVGALLLRARSRRQCRARARRR